MVSLSATALLSLSIAGCSRSADSKNFTPPPFHVNLESYSIGIADLPKRPWCMETEGLPSSIPRGARSWRPNRRCWRSAGKIMAGYGKGLPSWSTPTGK